MALGVGLAGAAVLGIAAFLKPNSAGVGSHRQIGLPPCQFLHTTGLPCPACGMTTSFSWFVRGNLLASLYVQPMGAVLAVLTVVSVIAGFYIAWTGKPVYRLLYGVRASRLFLPLMMFGVLAWAWKMFIHLNGIDGWK